MSAGLAIQAKSMAARAQRSQLGQGAILTNPSGLRRFRSALGDALYTPVQIGCWGDSITEGVGTESPSSITSNIVADSDGWAGQLRTLFSRRFGTLAGGAITPFFSGTDTRVTRSGAPSIDNTIGPMKWGGRLKSGTSDVFEFTTPPCTAIDICYYAGGSADSSLIGGFSYQIDGGTITTGLAAGVNASPGYKVLTITGLPATAHTIRLAGLHATNLQHITGIRYHNNQGVVLSRWARAGWTILDTLGIGETSRNASCIGNSYNQSRMAAMWGGYGEHLTIIALGQNDASLQNVAMNGGETYTTPDVYEAYLRQAVAMVTGYGGCTLLLNTALPPASGSTVPVGGKSYYSYHEAARRIAHDTDHVAHLSIADRWGMTNDSTAAENVALAMLSSPHSVHPSRRGYGDIAGALIQTLFRHDLVTKP